MIIVDVTGIVVGVVLGKQISERDVTFILFGPAGLKEFFPAGGAPIPLAARALLVTSLQA